MNRLEATLREVRDRGAKSFVPYVTGGYPGVDLELLRRLAAAGADAIEVGIPHSDPIMDGGVIQEASRVALERGTRLDDVLAVVAAAAVDAPVAVMTYANIVHHRGYEAFCDDLAGSGVAGAIVPDLPVDEAERFGAIGAARGIDVVLLAAPGTKPERYEAIASASHGFVYCVATYGVTGGRDELPVTAREVVAAVRPHRPAIAGRRWDRDAGAGRGGKHVRGRDHRRFGPHGTPRGRRSNRSPAARGGVPERDRVSRPSPTSSPPVWGEGGNDPPR
jgi:tryptophan synthase alpha chain